MRYAHLYAKLFCEPLALDPGHFAAFEHLLLNAMGGTLPANLPQAAKIDPQRRDARTDSLLERIGSTAVIHIDGAIDRHLSSMDRICFDAVDTADIQNALQEADRDRTIANILLQINSPGGGILGVPELFAQVSDIGKRKNVFAFTDGMCCSAAYWIAAGCAQIFATSSSIIGSVGVYCAVTDSSGQLAQRGQRVEVIQSGDLKTAGHPAKPMSPAERVSIQDRVDEAGNMFRGDVLAARPSIAADALQGQAFYARQALAEGLVDALVSSREEALAQFP